MPILPVIGSFLILLLPEKNYYDLLLIALICIYFKPLVMFSEIVHNTNSGIETKNLQELDVWAIDKNVSSELTDVKKIIKDHEAFYKVSKTFIDNTMICNARIVSDKLIISEDLILQCSHDFRVSLLLNTFTKAFMHYEEKQVRLDFYNRSVLFGLSLFWLFIEKKFFNLNIWSFVSEPKLLTLLGYNILVLFLIACIYKINTVRDVVNLNKKIDFCCYIKSIYYKVNYLKSMEFWLTIHESGKSTQEIKNTIKYVKQLNEVNDESIKRTAQVLGKNI